MTMNSKFDEPHIDNFGSGDQILFNHVSEILNSETTDDELVITAEFIKGGWDSNGRFWNSEMLEKGADHYNSILSYDRHYIDDSPTMRSVVGYTRNARYDAERNSIVGEVVVHNDHKDFVNKALEIKEITNGPGLSHAISATIERKLHEDRDCIWVNEIVKAHSVDWVTEPAQIMSILSSVYNQTSASTEQEHNNMEVTKMADDTNIVNETSSVVERLTNELAELKSERDQLAEQVEELRSKEKIHQYNEEVRNAISDIDVPAEVADKLYSQFEGTMFPMDRIRAIAESLVLNDSSNNTCSTAAEEESDTESDPAYNYEAVIRRGMGLMEVTS